MSYGKALWSVPLEVAYQTFSSKDASGGVTMDYSAFDILIGVRRYFPLNDNARIYLTGSIDVGIPQSSSIKIASTVLPVSLRASGAFALGIKVKRFSGELYYVIPRNVLINTSNYYEGKMPTIALNLGYVLTKGG